MPDLFKYNPEPLRELQLVDPDGYKDLVYCKGLSNSNQVAVYERYDGGFVVYASNSGNWQSSMTDQCVHDNVIAICTNITAAPHTSYVMPKLRHFIGNVDPFPPASFAYPDVSSITPYPRLEYIGGWLNIEPGVFFPSLRIVGDSLQINNDDASIESELNALIGVGGDTIYKSNRCSLPNLRFIGGGIHKSFGSSLSAITEVQKLELPNARQGLTKWTAIKAALQHTRLNAIASHVTDALPDDDDVAAERYPGLSM